MTRLETALKLEAINTVVLTALRRDIENAKDELRELIRVTVGRSGCVATFRSVCDDDRCTRDCHFDEELVPYDALLEYRALNAKVQALQKVEFKYMSKQSRARRLRLICERPALPFTTAIQRVEQYSRKEAA